MNKVILVVGVIIFIFGNSTIAQEKENSHMHHQGHDMEYINSLRFNSDYPEIESYGSWESVIPKPKGASIDKSLGMQTVHSIMLPSGKILMLSGSSWRNLAPMEYYPQFKDPVAGKGLFDRRFDPFHNSKILDYYQLINNSAIYDPVENTFFRIPSPFPVNDKSALDHFIPSDMFCTGHLHLPNGNPLFVGGTQYYYPYRTGHNSSYIFDWKKELKIDWQYVDWRQKPIEKNDPWVFSGLMKRGRWYPGIVPLLDGRLVITSGYVGFDKGYQDMYQFEINHFVEFFDYHAFDRKDPQTAWKSVDVQHVKDSPFSTLLDSPQQIDNICYDMRHLEKLGFDIGDNDFVQPCDCPERCFNDHKYDAFKLYPHNYLVGANKIFLSREGDWVSLRTPKTEYMRRTKFTYWMEILGDRGNPSIKFNRGPDRKEFATSYGTSFIDPNTKLLTILGGQKASEGTLLPIGSKEPNRFAGGRGSRKIEQIDLNAKSGEGSWSLIEDYLGTNPQEDRTMHYAIILPTRQILIINGGNYDFYGAVKYPILLTPNYERDRKFIGYNKQRMAEAIEPRLYHNNAMLLPDGRVFVSGGNSGRATVKLDDKPISYENINGQPLPNTDLVELDLYFLTDGQMAKQEKGTDNTPIENWTAEIFSPPYMFIDKERELKISAIKTQAKSGIVFNTTIDNKEYTLFHSNREYEIKMEGEFPNKEISDFGSLVLLKLPSVTHGGQWGQLFIDIPITEKTNNGIKFITPDAIDEGIPPGFYMLFYIDSSGRPTESRMVKFDDNSREI